MSNLPVPLPPGSRVPSRPPASAIQRGQAALARRGTPMSAAVANWTPPERGGGGQGVGLSDMVRGVIPGLSSMAGEIGRSAIGLGRLLVDAPRMAVDRDYDPTGGDYSTSGLLGHYLPFVETTRESYAGTLQRRPGDYLQAVRDGNWMPMLIEDVGNVSLLGYGAGRGLSAAGARTGSQALQRAGARTTQAAMLGDRFGAGPALPYLYGARGLARMAGPALRRIDTLYSGRTGRSLIDDARGAMDRNVWNPAPLDRRTAGVLRQSVERPRAALAATRLNPEVRRASRDIRSGAAAIGTEQLGVVKAAMETQRLPENVGIAAYMDLTDFHARFPDSALARLPDEQLARVLTEANPTWTPEAARIAWAKADGTLDAATRGQLDRAVEVLGEFPEIRTERQSLRPGETLEEFQARTGVETPLNPEQLGQAPMTSAVERLTREQLGLPKNRSPEQAVARLRRMADDAGERGVAARAHADVARDRGIPDRGPTTAARGAFRRGEGAGRLDERARVYERMEARLRRSADRLEAKAAEVRAEVAKTADAAPARYRSAILEAERGVESLRQIAEEFPEMAPVISEVIEAMPKTLDEMVAAGVDPVHLIGGETTVRDRTALRQQRSEMLPRKGADHSSRLASREYVDYRPSEQLVNEAFRTKRWMSRKVADDFDMKHGVNPSDVLPEHKLREVAGNGRAISEAMAEYGYEPWNPRAVLNWVPDDMVRTVDVARMDQLNQQAAATLGDAISIADMAAISTETRFLPRTLKEAFTYTMDTAAQNMAWQGLAFVNQKWKNALLPLSPSWYAGNSVGNALVAMVGEGIAPWDYPRYIIEGFRELRRTRPDGRPLAEGTMQMRRDAFAAGLGYAEAQMIDPSRMRRRAPLSIAGREVGYGRFRDWAYRTNELMDNLSKNAVFLHAAEQARRNPGAQRALFDAALSDAQGVARVIEQRVSRYADGAVPEGMQRRLSEARNAVLDIEQMGPANFAAAQADEYAVKRALNIMGDYHSMAPWEQKVVQVLPFYRWCVDEQTEALTQRGWVSGHDITTDDIILSMDPADGRLKWSPVRSIYYEGDYDGPMHRVRNQGIDALVSPGHSFLTQRGLVKIEDLRQRDVIRLMGDEAPDGDGRYDDEFVEIVGWAVTEGHYRKNRITVEISQKDGTDNAERIAKVLDHYGATFHTYLGGVDMAIRYFGVGGEVAKAIRDVAPGRVMTWDFLWGLTAHQRERLIEVMLEADGAHVQRGRGDCPTFTQENQAAAEAFVTLCTLAGRQTYMRRDGDCFKVSVRGRKTTGVRRIEGWADPSNRAPVLAQRPTERYRGLLWCPETAYGTFVCRRGGITHVTGNTRHITQLTLRLPIEHPARVAWTLNLATLFAPDQSDLPEWMRGGINIGSFYMPGQFLNPWGDVTDQGGSLLSATEFMRSVSPGIKIPVAALTGRNLARGGDPLTRPRGSGPMDRFGREDEAPPLMWGNPLNWRLRELAGYSIGQLPLTRNIRDIATGGRPLYDTGEVMRRRGGTPLPAREHPYGALRPLARAANLPMLVSERDLNEQARRFAANRRTYERAQDRRDR